MAKVSKKKWTISKKLWISLGVICLLFAGSYYASGLSLCSTVASTAPQQMLQKDNSTLINLANGLGAQSPIKACTNLRLKMSSGFDGYHPYVIKTEGDQSSKLESLKCPQRSVSDNSNSLNLGYVKSVFKVKDPNAYYSAEGAQCTAGDVNAIVIARDRHDKPDTYIVFTAR